MSDKMREALQAAMNDTPGWYDLAKSALSDTSIEASTVEGWVMVPVEPTQEMIEEAISEYVGDVDALEAYRSMLAAAPIYPNKCDGIPEKLWQSLFWDLAKELKCLPSSFVDANEHVFNKARKLIALSGESGISYSSHKPMVFHDRESTKVDLVVSLVDKLKQHIPYRDESGVIGFDLHDYGRILQLAEAALLSAAPPPPSAPVQQSVLGDEWQPINTADLTDDLVWLFDGVDSIAGPRTLEHDDYDRYAYWAPVTWPSTMQVRAKSPSVGLNTKKGG